MSNRSILKTRVFEIAEARNMRLPELAAAMQLDKSVVWRTKVGQRGIGEPFITGATRAFPDIPLDELFYVEEVESNDEETSDPAAPTAVA